jgi:hypothetical protein
MNSRAGQQQCLRTFPLKCIHTQTLLHIVVQAARVRCCQSRLDAQIITMIYLHVDAADAAGMTTSSGGRFFNRKDNGLVKDVFQGKDMLQLQVSAGVCAC